MSENRLPVQLVNNVNVFKGHSPEFPSVPDITVNTDEIRYVSRGKTGYIFGLGPCIGFVIFNRVNPTRTDVAIGDLSRMGSVAEQKTRVATEMAKIQNQLGSPQEWEIYVGGGMRDDRDPQASQEDHTIFTDVLNDLGVPIDQRYISWANAGEFVEMAVDTNNHKVMYKISTLP